MLKEKYFKEANEISRNLLEEKIVEALDNQCPVKDVVGLLVMYLFTTILFPQVSGFVPIHMFRYAEQLDGLKDLNWAEGVLNHLKQHIRYCVVWCKMIEEGRFDSSPECSDSQVRSKKKLKQAAFQDVLWL